MIIELSSGEFEVTPKNGAFFRGNTLINCLYVDFPDDYIVIPKDENVTPAYENVYEQGIKEGIPVYDLHDYDPEAFPICFIINAYCRLFRDEINQITEKGIQ